MLKRLLTAFAVLALMTGFIAACGDDDDDDVATDDTEETTDDEMVDGGEPITDFCADVNEPSEGDTPIEDVQTSRDTAAAAQAAVDDPELADAIGMLVDFADYAIDNDDGDGVVTDAEVAAAAAEFPTLEDAFAVVSEACS